MFNEFLTSSRDQIVSNLFVVTLVICKLYRSNAFRFTSFEKSASSFQIRTIVDSFRMEALTRKPLQRRTWRKCNRKKAKRKEKNPWNQRRWFWPNIVLPVVWKLSCPKLHVQIYEKNWITVCSTLHANAYPEHNPFQNWNSSAIVCSMQCRNA